MKLQEEVHTLRQDAATPVKLTADDIYEGSLKLGMKQTTAAFFHGQLRNCNRKSKGDKTETNQLSVLLITYILNRFNYP